MSRNRKVISLIFPPALSLSQELIEGIVERHLKMKHWILIEVQKTFPGVSPFTGEDFHLDGVITWAEARDLWIHDLVAKGIPVVNCGSEWVGCKGVASVRFDFDEIHRTVIDHFLALGIHRIIAMGHMLEKRPATARILEDFVRLAHQAGMQSSLWELDGPDSPSISPSRLLNTEHEVALAAFLTTLEKPSGIFCLGDHIGYIVAAVAARLNIEVPRDLAICGFGNLMVANYANPPLSSVSGAARMVGRSAADCLNQWLENGAPPQMHQTISGAKLIARESTVGGSGSVILESIRRHVATHARTGVALEDLVNLSQWSVKTLVRKYQEHFGVDPISDIHQHRIDEAKKLLASDHLKISEIAQRCGFSSQAAFANYFQRQTGTSPGEYRKSAKESPRSTD